MSLTDGERIKLLLGPKYRVQDLHTDKQRLALVLNQQAGANLLPQAGPWFTTDGPHRKITTAIPTPFNPLGGTTKKKSPSLDEGKFGNDKEVSGGGNDDITIPENQ